MLAKRSFPPELVSHEPSCYEKPKKGFPNTYMGVSAKTVWYFEQDSLAHRASCSRLPLTISLLSNSRSRLPWTQAPHKLSHFSPADVAHAHKPRPLQIELWVVIGFLEPQITVNDPLAPVNINKQNGVSAPVIRGSPGSPSKPYIQVIFFGRWWLWSSVTCRVWNLI